MPADWPVVPGKKWRAAYVEHAHIGVAQHQGRPGLQDSDYRVDGDAAAKLVVVGGQCNSLARLLRSHNVGNGPISLLRA